MFNRSVIRSGEKENGLPHGLVADFTLPKKGQFAALPELQNYQPHQLFEQSHVESHLE